MEGVFNGPGHAAHSLRRRVFLVLETSTAGSRLGRIVDGFLIALIVASVIAVILESVKALEIRFAAAFYWFEVFTVAVFTVEYALRLWISVETETEERPAPRPLVARLRFVSSFHAIIDLLAILPFYLLTFGLFGGADMRFLRAVRLLRVLKLTRYSSAFNTLVATIAENGRSLAASFFILLVVMMLAASGMYYFERHAQPADFGSIPAAMWWAFATLTTVGYGDVIPITVGGKVFGALITVVGLGMVALPTAILASGFAQQLRINSERYQAQADRALEDGALTADEVSELEELRVDLGLGKNTASQILDAQRVRQALAAESDAERCPHCGALR